MNNVYGYIRVSDKKQEQGASLSEQKRILSAYAKAHDLNIIHFYKETKTAAKRGRPFFTEMMKNLKQGKAQGVIIHKIDRSARNLHDWADIGDLIDNNIQVYFAHENLNLNERGGRLSADIQAVMASDYVRNLRQEIVKGMYGRLKEGIYPWGAPVGYLNHGKGKLKTIDPLKAPLIQELFELYASEKYNIISLAKEMKNRGLRNNAGNFVDKNSIITILKNPFYIGIMEIKGQSFQGKHEPIIPARLFKQVQLILKARDRKTKGTKHFYLFRKLLKCHECNSTMSGEKQKGRVYYRCQRKGCPTTGIREDMVEYHLRNQLKHIELYTEERSNIDDVLNSEKKEIEKIKGEKTKVYQLQIAQLQQQEEKLLDAYLENIIEKNDYQRRKKKLMIKLRELQDALELIDTSTEASFKKIEGILELCYKPLNIYDSSINEEKREYIQNVISNLTVDAKKVYFSMCLPYKEILKTRKSGLCAHIRDTPRNLTSSSSRQKTDDKQVKPLKKEEIKQFIRYLLVYLNN